MAKNDTTSHVAIAILAWILGSAIVGGFLKELSSSAWMDWIIIIFVLAYGGTIIWIYKQMY